MVFMAFTANVHAVDYSYVLRDELPSNAKILTQEPGNSYSCVAEWFAGATSGTVNMTPVFEDNCGIGLHAEEDNPECVVTTYAAPLEGMYIDLKTGKSVACPFGYYCPGDSLTGVEFTIENNETICDNEANIAEDGWSNTKQDGTTLGKCRCPRGTYTGAVEAPGVGTNAASILSCTWRQCGVGQQLGKNAVTGEYECQPCEAGYYCVGGMFDSTDEYIEKSRKACPTKVTAGAGHSDAGAFRCEYTCDAGDAMRMRGEWYKGDTDCEPCPEGSYCPGDDGDPRTYFKSTEYEEGETEDLADGYLGNKSCPNGYKTFGTGKTSENDCVIIHHCDAGYFWNKNAKDEYGNPAPKCSECNENNADYETGSYCPGGDFKDDNDGGTGKIGMYKCQQYLVTQEIEGGSRVVVFDPDSSDENSPYASLSMPVKDGDGNYSTCRCPNGFLWNYTTHTCCESLYNDSSVAAFCCPPGMEKLTTANSQTCRTCSGTNTTSTTNVIGLSDESSYYVCPGIEVVLKLDKEACIPNENQFVNLQGNCEYCGQNAKPVTPTVEGAFSTSCECVPVAGEPDGVRTWRGGAPIGCTLDTYRVEVYYANITLDNKVSTKGKIVDWSSVPYWQTTYEYGHKWNGESTTQLWNGVTPTDLGYEFKGYCRDTKFCCPSGYRIHQDNGAYTCVECSEEERTNSENDAYASCQGSNWTAADDIANIIIDPENPEFRKPEIIYYAQMKEVSDGCEAGTYLTWKDGNVADCKSCEDGYYCTGGERLSSSNTGKFRCPKDTYFGWGQNGKMTGSASNGRASVESDCLSCTALVTSDLFTGNHSALRFKYDNVIGTDYRQCGYYCKPGFYASAADNHDPYNCNVPCETGSYCPGGGKKYYDYSSAWHWLDKFYPVEQGVIDNELYGPGKGKFLCPEGLTSDEPTADWTNAGKGGPWECYRSECSKHEYVLKNTNVSGGLFGKYECQDCSYPTGNDTETGVYYQCLLQDSMLNVGLDIQPWSGTLSGYTDFRDEEYPGYAVHNGSAGKTRCGTNQRSKTEGANRYECYNVPTSGSFENPFGEITSCLSGFYCSSSTVSGILPCPAGSTSTEGATSILDCKCNYGEAYMPAGVYKERNVPDDPETLTIDEAELKPVQIDGSNYVCLNTYLVVDNEVAYENPTSDGSISPSAGARVVECKWNANTNKYDICADKAIRICNTNLWENPEDLTAGYAHRDLLKQHVEDPDAILDDFRSATGAGSNIALFGNTAVADVNGISMSTTFGPESCPIVCKTGYSLPGDGDACCATIGYSDESLAGSSFAVTNPNPKMYCEGHGDITLNNPTKDYHNFLGWCEGAENTSCTPTSDTYTIAEAQSGDLFFTAKWQMVCPAGFEHKGADDTQVNQCNSIVKFYKNYGENDDEPVSTYTAVFSGSGTGDTYLVPANEFPTTTTARTGYTLSGWYQVANPGTGDAAVTSETALAGDKNLYANWTPITYTVRFDGNGADNASADPAPMSPESFTYDIVDQTLTQNAFTRNGYGFKGWCQTADGCAENVHYTDGAAIGNNLADTQGAEVPLYAVWDEITYNINYDGVSLVGSNFETSNPNPTTYTITTPNIVLENPTKDGFEFTGWCLADETPDVCRANTIETVTDPVTGEVISETVKRVIAQGTYGDLTFKATWKATGCPDAYVNRDAGADTSDKTTCYATVTFDTQGGSAVNPNPVKIHYQAGTEEDTYTITTLPTTTLDGHDFDGWYLVENPGESDDKITAPRSFATDVTLYAKWTPIEYTVHFNGNGADEDSPIMTDQTFTYGVEDALTANAFTRSGWSFVGWCKTADGCDEAVDYTNGQEIPADAPLATVATTVQLYAVWVHSNYQIVFDKNTDDTYCDDEKGPANCTYGEYCDITDYEISRSDYELVGWCKTADGCAENVDYTTSVTQTEPLTNDTLTLFAVWKPVCNSGKRLHVGDKDMCLYTISRTPVSLVVMIDGVKYYANMCKASDCDSSMSKDAENQKLHIMYNEELYNVYDLTAQ